MSKCTQLIIVCALIFKSCNTKDVHTLALYTYMYTCMHTYTHTHDELIMIFENESRNDTIKYL